MSSATELLKSIQDAAADVTLAELLAQHPDLARRTAQRWINAVIGARQITAQGDGRARRYCAVNTTAAAATEHDIFPSTSRFPTIAGTFWRMLINRCKRASPWVISAISSMPTGPM